MPSPDPAPAAAAALAGFAAAAALGGFAAAAPASAAVTTQACLQQDLAACRALLAGGSRSFALAARLLPRRVRDPATALYAFCRLADDAVDLDPRPGALPRLHARLARLYAGHPEDSPADRALARVVVAHAIPYALPAALLEGFAWDHEGRRYATLAELEAYAARVAGTVGVMLALLMGVRSPAALARAADLGCAMQLSNIARDVGEDARAGRLYLPTGLLTAAGIDAHAFVEAPTPSPALAAVVAQLLARADQLYARAAKGIALLPRDCRPGIDAALRLYAAIGHQVASQGLDPVTSRAIVPRGKKLRLLAACPAALFRRPPAAAPPLPATRFLLDAVPAPTPPAPRGLEARVAWLVALFTRLEQRERRRTPQPRHRQAQAHA